MTGENKNNVATIVYYLIASFFVFVVAVLLGGSLVISPVFAVIFFLLPIAFLAIVSLPNLGESKSETVQNNLLYSLCAYIFLFIVWPRYISIPLSDFPDLNLQRIAYVLLVSYWLYCLSSVPALRGMLKNVIVKNLFIFVTLGVLLLCKLVSVANSVNFFGSFITLANEVINYMLLFIILVSAIRTEKDLERLLVTIYCAGVIVVVLGVIEGITKSNYIVKFMPAGFGLSSDYIEQITSEKLRGGGYRVQSMFEHPLLLSEFLFIMFPIACYFAFVSRVKFISISTYVVLPLIVLVSFYSGSRSALLILGMIIGLLLFLYSVRQFYLNKKISSIILLILIIPATLGGVYLFSDSILELVQGRSLQESQSTNARMVMLNTGLPIIMDRPFFGYGLGNAAEILGFTGRSNILTIDNYYLSVAIESGLPTLLMVLAVFVFLIVFSLNFWFKSLGKINSICGILGVSLLGVAVMKTVLSLPHNWPLIYFVFSLILFIRTSERSQLNIDHKKG